MHMLIFALTFLAGAAGLIAAMQWQAASELDVPPIWADTPGLIEPVDQELAINGRLIALEQSMRLSALLNAKAAKTTAIATLLTTAAGLFAWIRV